MTMKVYVIKDYFTYSDTIAIYATKESAEARLKELNSKYEAYYIDEEEVLS